MFTDYRDYRLSPPVQRVAESRVGRIVMASDDMVRLPVEKRQVGVPCHGKQRVLISRDVHAKHSAGEADELIDLIKVGRRSYPHCTVVASGNELI